MESFTSGTMSTEDEADIDLEDLTWSIMQKSGFMSGIKSQILQFIQENRNLEQEFTVIPERANPAILAKIYEYLDWVGLKETCMKLLAESPVEIDVVNVQAGEIPTNDEPELCKMFQSIPVITEAEGKTVADKSTPCPLNDTYDVTTGNKAQEGSLLHETEASNLFTVNPPEEGLISMSSLDGESEKTEDFSVKSTTKLNISSNEQLILLPQQLPSSSGLVQMSSNPVSSSSEAKNKDEEGVAGSDNENSSDHSDPSARLLKLFSFSSRIVKVIPPDNGNIEKENEHDLSKEQSASAMSSIAEDSSMISDMSLYNCTEDLSVQSSVNGMSSAEHKLNLK